jgi:hypothetical protein
MDFKDTILQLSERIRKQKDSIATEEATKNAFVMPMLVALGYDIFNPDEVIPEYTCDAGTKKGEKIDYAIMKGASPILLIECKHCAQNLEKHSNQLLRYFCVSSAKFAMLTNGIVYRFYTDLDKTNVMDEKPFLNINLLDLSDDDIDQLKKFHKSYYNEPNILSTAQELKYTTEIKKIISADFSSPTSDYVKFIAKKVYDGQVTANVIQQFTPMVKKSITAVVNDIISDRLNVVIQKGEPSDDVETESGDSKKLPDGVIFIDEKAGIATTQEEIDGYNIVRSILRKHVSADKIIYQDYKTYFVIAIHNAYWWVCRLSLKQYSKRIGFPTEDRKDCKWVQIESLDDIFKYADQLEHAFTITNEAREQYKIKHQK